MRRSHRLRNTLVVSGAIAAIVALGPRPRVDAPTVAPKLPEALSALPAWLAAREVSAGVIDTNVAKRIVFANASVPSRTMWSVVYLHGFSATRQETAPLSEQVAQTLGANLFETRLAGHGLPGDSLAHVTAQQWLADAVEALAIGRALGDSVLVIGTSTGGTLAVWLATQPASAQAGLARLVLISPNFGPKDKAAGVLTLPWANVLLPRFIPQRTWEAKNAEQQRYWTVSYPSTALFPMQALVERVRSAPLDNYRVPTLVFSNPGDPVVDAARTGAWVARAARTSRATLQHRFVTPAGGDDPHVLAGRIVSPTQTATFVERVVSWVRAPR